MKYKEEENKEEDDENKEENQKKQSIKEIYMEQKKMRPQTHINVETNQTE